MAFVVALAAVAWTSLLPPDDVPSAFGLSDKVVHLLGYLLLGALAVVSGLTWPRALAAVVAFGAVLELLQGALGYRSAEWADLLADAAGAALGVAAATAVLRQVAAHQQSVDRDRKRERRRQRAQQAQAAPERPMNREKAAARSGPPRWQQVAERQGVRCWLCGARTHRDDRRRTGPGQEELGATHPVVDYVIAPEKGGTYAWENVRLAHVHCRRVREAQPARETFGVPPRTFPSRSGS